MKLNLNEKKLIFQWFNKKAYAVDYFQHNYLSFDVVFVG